ncbi:MAG: hypothetical protein HY731_13350 [Candidatus Tectomicrobia bacterium]|nr:hypothetical protein [Candidatus Tectomicrobia bacterium]
MSLRNSYLLLRYVDAEPFDYTSDSALTFLKEKLKINFELLSSLFEGEQVKSQPDGVNFQIAYTVMRPKGRIQLKVATGDRRQEKAIIWETMVLSHGQDLPVLPGGACE